MYSNSSRLFCTNYCLTVSEIFLTKMKAFMLCACVLALAAFSSATVKQKLRQSMKKSDADEDYGTCMAEHHMNMDEWYTEEDIVHDRHIEAENEERTRKLGCVLECAMRKDGVMHGTEFDEATMRTKLDEEISEPEVRIVAKEIIAECMKEAKPLTEECEKGAFLYVCCYKAIHELQELAEELDNSQEE